jgi:hypothetical protein
MSKNRMLHLATTVANDLLGAVWAHVVRNGIKRTALKSHGQNNTTDPIEPTHLSPPITQSIVAHVNLF